MRALASLVLLAVCALGCSPPPLLDAGVVDAGVSIDAGSVVSDAGPPPFDPCRNNLGLGIYTLGVWPPTVPEGTPATVTWTSQCATGCHISSLTGPDKAQPSLPPNGSTQVYADDTTTLYSLACLNDSYVTNVLFEVISDVKLDEVSLLPTVVAPGGYADLTWSSRFTWEQAPCLLASVDADIVYPYLPGAGTMRVYVEETTSFVFGCFGPGVTAEVLLDLEVDAALLEPSDGGLLVDDAGECPEGLEKWAQRCGPHARVAKLEMGAHSSCALLDDGRLKCWGYNHVGQLGLGDRRSRGYVRAELGENLHAVDVGTGRTVSDVAAGFYHTCALLDDGSVKCWGRGSFGTLGRGDEEDIGDEPAEMGDALVAVDFVGHTALDIAVGDRHSCALLEDGNVKCWGNDTRAQLGSGAGFWTQDNWGDSTADLGEYLPALDLGSDVDVVEIHAGGFFSCVLTSDGRVKCWGDNVHGQLGQGVSLSNVGRREGQMGDALPFVALGSGDVVAQLALGWATTCVRLTSGVVKCWGAGADGLLGFGTVFDRGSQPSHMGDGLIAVPLPEPAVHITVEQTHACAVLVSGAVKCWGNNDVGQLGQGNTSHLGDVYDLYDAPNIDLDPTRLGLAVAAGSQHTCVVLDDGRVKCWGEWVSGQLGNGFAGVVGDEPGEMGAALLTVPLGFGGE